MSGLWSWKCCYSRHSGIMHFSTSSTSAPQMEPSAGGIFTMRSLLFMPTPQVALQTSHSAHSVTRQLLGAKAKRERQGTVNPQHNLHWFYSMDRYTWCVMCQQRSLTHGKEGGKLTAVLVDHTVFSLLCGQGADWAIIRELLHITLPGTCAHPTGQTTGRPGDPLWHHAGGSI